MLELRLSVLDVREGTINPMVGSGKFVTFRIETSGLALRLLRNGLSARKKPRAVQSSEPVRAPMLDPDGVTLRARRLALCAGGIETPLLE